MKQIKFRSRTERVLRTSYVVMYAFRSKTELVPVFQSTGTLVPFGIPAESGRNVQPRMHRQHRKGTGSLAAGHSRLCIPQEFPRNFPRIAGN